MWRRSFDLSPGVAGWAGVWVWLQQQLSISCDVTESEEGPLLSMDILDEVMLGEEELSCLQINRNRNVKINTRSH
jgi:hypothetical protein